MSGKRSEGGLIDNLKVLICCKSTCVLQYLHSLLQQQDVDTKYISETAIVIDLIRWFDVNLVFVERVR